MGDRCRLPGAGEAMGVAVSASDPKAFAAQVERVLADADLRARLAAAGRAVVHARYTWRSIAERALEPFAGALDAGAAQRR